jgi:hypothetical protein
MTKKKYILIAASLLVLIAVIGFSARLGERNHKNMLKVESATFEVAGGWGYNVLVDHKVFIHQQFMPAVQGYKVFRSKEDAEKIANFQIHKLMNKKVPAISVKDLDSLHITY